MSELNLLLVVNIDFVHRVKDIDHSRAFPMLWSNKNINWVSLCFVNLIATARHSTLTMLS